MVLFKNPDNIASFEIIQGLPYAVPNGQPITADYVKKNSYILSFDQATGITGMGIFKADTGDLVGVAYFKHTKPLTKSQFRIELKRFIVAFCSTYPVSIIIHEGTFDKTYNSSVDLNQFKTIFEDIKNEYFPFIEIKEYNNKWWKKRFVYPEKVTMLGSRQEKIQICRTALNLYPALETLSIPQDVYDAVGIGQTYFNILFKRLPSKLIYTKPKLNQRLAVTVEVGMFSTPEEVHISSPVLQVYSRRHGLKNCEFNTKLSLEDNIRLQSQTKEGLLYFVIPEYIGTGEICLKYNCPYKKDSIMVAFGKLKKAK